PTRALASTTTREPFSRRTRVLVVPPSIAAVQRFSGSSEDMRFSLPSPFVPVILGPRAWPRSCYRARSSCSMSPSSRVNVGKLRASLDQTAAPVFVPDARRRLVYANRAWELLTGVEAVAVIGREFAPTCAGHDGQADVVLASFSPPPEALTGLPAGGTI